jgi:hypothetical protein
MFKTLTLEEVACVKQEPKNKSISRWETIEKAKLFYENLPEQYGAYEEKREDLISAYATPVFVFRLKNEAQ